MTLQWLWLTVFFIYCIISVLITATCDSNFLSIGVLFWYLFLQSRHSKQIFLKLYYLQKWHGEWPFKSSAYSDCLSIYGLIWGFPSSDWTVDWQGHAKKGWKRNWCLDKSSSSSVRKRIWASYPLMMFTVRVTASISSKCSLIAQVASLKDWWLVF